jgi:hypothetical protein
MEKTNPPPGLEFFSSETVSPSLPLSPVALNFPAAFRDLIVNDPEFHSQVCVVRMILELLRQRFALAF